MKRRSFLHRSSSLIAASIVTGAKLSAQESQAKRRVAIIGHTGRGDFGHGLDTVWLKIPEAEIVGVADGNEAGLAKELSKLGVQCGYTDYGKMLTDTRPEFVSICPRHADQHQEMALAALEAGARGLYIEKPFCRTPAEADSLLAACQQHHAKIAVAHRNRYHPTLKQIDHLIASGQLGKLLEIRGRGKGDRRGGGEDLWVLGGHVINLMEYFAGAPKSCSAIMLQDGRRITSVDVKPGAEGLGPLAANEVHARFETAKGIVCYYDSIANDGTNGTGYCMQLIGSQGVVTLHIDQNPVAHFTPGNPFLHSSEARTWVPITTAGLDVPEDNQGRVSQVYNHVLGVQDLIESCDTDRQPLCDARAGAVAVEAICGVFESHRQGGATVDFPLRERRNPLSLL